MSDTQTCPHCGANLSYEVNGTVFSHAQGWKISGIYDGVLFWQCPFCHRRWHRFEPGTPQFVKAVPYVEGAS